jgi:hypothetical protein
MDGGDRDALLSVFRKRCGIAEIDQGFSQIGEPKLFSDSGR